jgi:hypothetical protein
MKSAPMIGEFALEGVEYVESSERLALVEHRVPGLKGNYFQQMGSVPNSIIVRGTRYGDDGRDKFLNGIREIFNKAEPTTFVADINTATDITDVLVEDLRVAEIGGTADTFAYEIRIRKYVKPPEPPKTDALDTGILGDASSAVGALDTLDALGSAPNLGDPTPPLNDSLKAVESATSALPGVVQSIGSLTGALPAAQPKTDSLAPLLGDNNSGAGVAGALKVLQDLGGKNLSVSLSADLGSSFSAKVSAGAPGDFGHRRHSEGSGHPHRAPRRQARRHQATLDLGSGRPSARRPEGSRVASRHHTHRCVRPDRGRH